MQDIETRNLEEDTSEKSTSQVLLEQVERYRILIIIVASIIAIFIVADLLAGEYDIPYLNSFLITLFWTVIGLALVGLIRFYISPRRLEQKFNQFHASHFLSSFFRIYFPVVIIALVLEFAVTYAIAPTFLGGLGIFDYDSISPSLMIGPVISSLVTAIGVIVLSDYEMKKNNLHYSVKVGKTPFIKSVAYILPLTGLYFGLVFLVRFLIQLVIGPAGLIPSSPNIIAIESGAIRAARFWDLLTDTERNLVLITFIVSYIAMEVLLRGLIASQARGYKLGASGIVLLPAVLQATAFSSGTSLFSEPIYYLFEIFDALLLGIVLGIIMWRTGNFVSVVFSGILIKLLDSRYEFQTVVIKILPETFGEYNPVDDIVSLKDTLGVYFIYVQIAVVVISPFILIVSYEEVGRIISSIHNGLKEQWFGLFIFGFAFFLIDLVFYFVINQLGLGFFLGFIIALVAIGFVLRFLFRVLPEPTEPPILHSNTDMFDGELPLNILNDIKYLKEEPTWYHDPKYAGLFGALSFLYFLFLSATYRQTYGLEAIEVLTFITFLVILPTLIIGSASYLIMRAYRRGFFFSENWRSSLFIFSAIMFVINILIWTDRSSTVDFSWRLVPFAIVFILLLENKPLEAPTRDLALGLARDGRYATFRWVGDNQSVFESHFSELLDLPSDNIKVGCYILASKQNLLDQDNLISLLRDRDSRHRGDVIGATLALGLMSVKSAEGLLLDIISDEDVDVKIAGYWSLGQVGSPRALSRMAKTLEENPKKKLVPIAESSILSIDPNYPLAGIRDSISIQYS